MGRKQAGSRSGVHGLSDLSAEEVAARMTKVGEHLEAINSLLGDAMGVDAAQRRTAARLRGPDEVDALKGVLQFAALHEELFTALADEDEGVDPTKFETDMLTNRLENAQALSAMADRIATLQQKLSDCALYTTQLVKPVVLKAYDIGKPFAERVSNGKLLYPARNLYRAFAQKGAKKRAAKKASSAPTGNGTS